MSVPKFQYKKPLIVELSTGVSGSRNGVPLVRREFFGLNDQCNTQYWTSSRNRFQYDF